MSKFVRILLALFAVVSYSMGGCTYSDEKEIDNAILGSWKWVNSSGGFAGTTDTPESTGESRRVVFEENGGVAFYENGEISIQSTFTCGLEKTIIAKEKHPVVYIEGSFMYAYSFSSTGRLILYDNMIDGYTHIYEKIVETEI